jgi:hypothetical protein
LSSCGSKKGKTVRLINLVLLVTAIISSRAWGAEVVLPEGHPRSGELHSCEGRNIEIIGSEQDASLVCPALQSVMSYFSEKGVVFPVKEFKVVFSPSLKIKLPDFDEAFLVHGLYDSRTNIVYLTSGEGQLERKPFGIAWDSRFLRSYLEHELTHFLVISLLPDAKNLTAAWHEYLAYTTQISLLPEDLREQVTANQKAFTDRAIISNMIYGMDPEGFAVRSFLGMEALGGDDLIRDLVSGRNPIFANDVKF